MQQRRRLNKNITGRAPEEGHRRTGCPRLPQVLPSVLVLLLLMSWLWSCGGGGGSSGSGSGNATGVAANAAGTTECYGCHADGSLPGDAGAPVFSLWLAGPHGNNESMTESHQRVDRMPDNTGFPDFGYNGLGTDPDCTLVCHDPFGDGEQLALFFRQTGIDDLGRVDRPVVGCEGCHGSGAEHFGIGEIPDPAPGPDACGPCHNEDFDHLAYHPEGDRIYEDYGSSAHAASISAPHYVSGSTTDVRARCSKCHTDEGARQYRHVSGGHDALEDALPNTLPPVENASVVQCRTCHEAHNPWELLLAEGEDVLGNPLSSEYRTCTHCHQTEDAYHGENSPYSWSGFALGAGDLDTSRIIYDTHFDDPATPEIEGYVLDPSDERVCRNCHNPHNADTTRNQEWARSAHGGHIADTVDPATGRARVTDAEGPAWVHYDFKEMTGGWTGTGRQACQRCHTATGYRNLANDPGAYDPADNEFFATGEQREMLYCWACHTSNVGDLRDPGPFAGTSLYTIPADRIAAVPDLEGSNICLSCHAGRESGLGSIDASTGDFSNKSFINPHYLTAGGVLFRTIGYEYSGRDYDNASYFVHDRIGTAGVPDTGVNGPCVGCHMSAGESHRFLPVEEDAGGAITDITAFGPICSKCHTDKSLLQSTLNELKPEPMSTTCNTTVN